MHEGDVPSIFLRSSHDGDSMTAEPPDIHLLPTMFLPIKT